MAQQLTFDLPVRTATGREDYFVSECNALAVQQLDAWQDWPNGKMILLGPMGSGKSHLAQVWVSETGARSVAASELAGMTPEPGDTLVEDVADIAGDNAAETALFHLHNLVLAEGGRLLMTGRGLPAHWPIALPDLASRLRATATAALPEPDDQLLTAVLVKLFTDRQIIPQPSLIPWLLRRMDRSLAEAGRIVAELDSRALATGRRIGPGLATEVLDAEPPDA